MCIRDSRAGREQLAVRRCDVIDDARERCGNVLGEVAAVGSWVADQLVPLVERLGEVQSPLRAEAKQAVGVALQFREVVEQRRQQPLRFAVGLLNRGGARSRPGNNRLRLFAPRAQARDPLIALNTKPGPGILAFVLSVAGMEARHDLDVVLWHKTANS